MCGETQLRDTRQLNHRTDAGGMIRPIQYLRAVAALMVVWVHAAGQLSGFVPPWKFGFSGVDLFFVISGFIMMTTTSERAVTAGTFLRSRLIRIVPLYWLATLVMIGCFLVAPGMFKTFKLTGGAFLESMLFIPSWSVSDPGQIFPLLVPGWTLNLEMFFYVLFAGSLFLPGCYRLAAVIGMLSSLVLAGHLLHPTSNAFAVTYTSAKLLEFAAGAVIAHLWRIGKLRMSLTSAIMAIGVGTVLIVLRGGPPLLDYAAAGSALIIGACLQPDIMAMESAVLGALGDASYSIYLSHLFTLGALRFVWARLIFAGLSPTSSIAFMAVSLVSCALVGCALFRYVERPLIARFRAKTSPK
jgi:exopolysaccharide production protein ExoZ